MTRIARPSPWLVLLALSLQLGLAGCSGATSTPGVRAFQLSGVVIALKPNRTQITVKHDDVAGFMPAMTMPFTVREPQELDGVFVGDLIRATLMVGDDEAWLTGIQKTGSLPPDQRSGPAGEPPAATLAPGAALPDLALVDQTGRPRPLASFRGTFVVVTFIYTSCPLPDYCPRMDKYFGALQRGILMAPPMRDSVRLLSISFDPDVDRPGVLLTHAKAAGAYDAVWTFATGEKAAVEAFGARVGLSVIREGKDGRQISHNLRTLLIDRGGTLVKIYNGNDWNPGDVLADLGALVK